jgi:hypothetical protein
LEARFSNRWSQPILFTTIKIFGVANCGAKLQFNTSFDNEQCIYVARIYCPRERQVHNMNIYLQPIIDELQLLWTQGVLVTNVSKLRTNQLLIVNVILLWTLHDYPRLGSCQVSLHHVLFEFSLQNAFAPTHFCKLYVFRYKM